MKIVVNSCTRKVNRVGEEIIRGKIIGDKRWLETSLDEETLTLGTFDFRKRETLGTSNFRNFRLTFETSKFGDQQVHEPSTLGTFD